MCALFVFVQFFFSSPPLPSLPPSSSFSHLLYVHRCCVCAVSFLALFFGVIYFIWLSSTRRIECENMWASCGPSNCLFGPASFIRIGGAVIATAIAVAAAAAAAVFKFCLAGDCITCCYRFVFILAARTPHRTLFILRRQESGANDEKYKQENLNGCWRARAHTQRRHRQRRRRHQRCQWRERRKAAAKKKKKKNGATLKLHNEILRFAQQRRKTLVGKKYSNWGSQSRGNQAFDERRTSTSFLPPPCRPNEK